MGKTGDDLMRRRDDKIERKHWRLQSSDHVECFFFSSAFFLSRKRHASAVGEEAAVKRQDGLGEESNVKLVAGGDGVVVRCWSRGPGSTAERRTGWVRPVRRCAVD